MLFQDDALLPWKTARDERRARPDLQRHRSRGGAGARRIPGSSGLASPVSASVSPVISAADNASASRIAQVLAMQPKLLLMDEPFASLDAIVRARIIQDVAALVERERISVLLVTHDLEEAISLSDCVYLLSQGPRARITQQYQVPIPRPRDPVQGARASRLRAALRETLERSLPRGRFRSPGGGRRMTTLDPRWKWIRQLVAFAVLLVLWEAAGRAGHAQSIVCAEPEQDRSGARRSVLGRPHLAASRRDLHRRARRPRARHCRRHSCSASSRPSFGSSPS